MCLLEGTEFEDNDRIGMSTIFMAVVMEHDEMDVFYVCKAKCKYLYWCRYCFDAGGHEKHRRYLHIHIHLSYAIGRIRWNFIKCNAMQIDMSQIDIKALSSFFVFK